MGWNRDLFRYMGALKKGRISSAHPTVDNKNAIAAMKNNYQNMNRKNFVTI